ncbi:unnamed protein product [marine sediment metagenome]|uniref:Uncharacterized protein n=1 Tax=marine sediment metagenome TaxID=412755 RepID=X1QDK9_9ZZZZ
MLYKAFNVTGEANKTVFDDGLVSTVEEPKKIRAVIISVSGWRSNNVEGWIETTRILEINDQVLNTSDEFGAANAYSSTVKMLRIPIEEDLKPGLTFKIAINSGAIPTSIVGAYEYEHVT